MPLPTSSSPWPHRLAGATALAAVPLVLFGGSVTTLRAGMAVEGWIFPEGHFLLSFPVEKWFRNLPTFVEHTHRLFGVLVGLCAIATLVACIATRAGGRAIMLAVLGLLAVCAQGALGGFRVLENSPQLAFLHGVCAQLVFAWLGIVALQLRGARRDVASRDVASRDVASRGGANARASAEPAPLGARAEMGWHGPSLRGAAFACTLLVVAQIALGAWYRHGLRTQLGATDSAALDMRLSLHLVGALAAFAAVLALAGRLTARASGAGGGEVADASECVRVARRLRVLLLVQLALGAFAWMARDPRGMTPYEWFASVAHVFTSALLLYTTACAWVLGAASRRAARVRADAQPSGVQSSGKQSSGALSIGGAS